MTIERLTIWTKNIEKIKPFYLEFFKVNANEKIISYFLSFPSGA